MSKSSLEANKNTCLDFATALKMNFYFEIMIANIMIS